MFVYSVGMQVTGDADCWLAAAEAVVYLAMAVMLLRGRQERAWIAYAGMVAIKVAEVALRLGFLGGA